MKEKLTFHQSFTHPDWDDWYWPLELTYYYRTLIWRYTCSAHPELEPPPFPPSLILEKELSLKVAQAGCQAADNSADSGVKRHRKPRKTKGWWWHGRQMTLLDLLMSFPFYFHAQGTPCCMELLLPMSNECISWRNVYTQSCSVSKETIDLTLTVTRGTLWSNNLFKSANIIILWRTKASLW